MKTTLTLCFLFIFYSGFTQELKEKKQNNGFSKEIFFVNKKDKLKNGQYLKINLTSKDTLIKGKYENDIKKGIWTYNTQIGIYEYDFDTNKLINNSKLTNSVDSFIVRENEKYVLKKVDNPPIFLGSVDEIKYLIQKTKLSESLSRSGKYGFSLISIDINYNGEITLSTINSLDSSFENSIIETLNKFKEKWLPARIDGEEIDSRILVKFVVTNNKDLITDDEKPYLWSFNYVLFGMSF